MTESPGAPEFHLYLPQMRLTMDAMVEKARAAEAAGFVGMAGMDHLAPPLAEQHDMYEALTTNAWLLARTERLVQGQLVLCDAFRHPATLAREAVTLDHASGGRFELGIGWGSVIEEFTTFGVSPTAARERVQRLTETLEILRGLWTGRAVRLRRRVLPARRRAAGAGAAREDPDPHRWHREAHHGARRCARRLVERPHPPARPSRRHARLRR